MSVLESSLLDDLSALVARRSGLRIDANKREELENAIRAVAEELGFRDAASCAKWFISATPTAAQIRVLACGLTVGETYFFREKASFQAFEERILFEMIHSRRGRDQRLRVWSAGCCTGEEAYSIAISLGRVLPHGFGWDVRILGTDINERFLSRGRDAIYGEWSFRDDPDDLRRRFFTQIGAGRHQLREDLRRRVTFAPLNLAEDVYPSPLNDTADMDVIFCRNVLMYMDESSAAKIVANLARCLADGGWLLVGAVEAGIVANAGLTPALIPGVTAFRKPARDVIAVPEPASRATPAPVIKPVAEEVVDAQTPVVRAAEAYRLGRYGEVIRVLLPYCESADAGADSLELLARAYANQGDGAEAFAWCERAAAVGKLNPRLRYLHAVISQERGDLEGARVSFRQAIYLDPEFVMAHVGAGHLALAMENRNEAAQHLLIARRLLNDLPADQPIPEADGLDARRLAALIAGEVEEGNAA